MHFIWNPLYSCSLSPTSVFTQCTWRNISLWTTFKFICQDRAIYNLIIVRHLSPTCTHVQTLNIRRTEHYTGVTVQRYDQQRKHSSWCLLSQGYMVTEYSIILVLSLKILQCFCLSIQTQLYLHTTSNNSNKSHHINIYFFLCKESISHWNIVK